MRCSTRLLTTGFRIGNVKNKFVFKCLLDSSGTDPMINRKCIPLNTVCPLNVKLEVCNSAKFLTTQGEFTLMNTVILQDICHPEFSFSCCFKTMKACIFSAPNCANDLLLGHKFMKQAKLKMDFETCQTTWLGSIIPFHLQDYFSDESKLPLISNMKQFVPTLLSPTWQLMWQSRM
jgi:hypothetical protein